MVGKISSALALSLLASTSAFAQATGSLTGSVVDPTGAPVGNVNVGLFVPGGAQALMSSKTNSSGYFTFQAVRPETYDVQFETPGFAKIVERRVKVDALRETSLAVKLEVASTQQVIEVLADLQAVQVTNSELSTTITRGQISDLPVLDRQVSNLFTTQAGVSSGRGPTVVNGLRTSAANVTMDGVNIQDNFIRTNSLDYMPFRPTIEQVADMTIAVGNASSAVGGGAAQIALNTRSGSNEYHGSLYWYNRNSAAAANDWFNNRAGVTKPFLNLNQVGGALGGKIIRDKLFFFVNYEAYRLRQQQSTLRTVLTPSARQGIFKYRDAGGVERESNLLNTRQIRIDPTIAGFIDQLPQPNTSDAGDGLNTSGFRFNASGNQNRDQLVTRWDYYMTPGHSFTGTLDYAKEVSDRPDIGNFYTVVPPVFNENPNKMIALGWRWTVSPTLTNEVRGGLFFGPGVFNTRNAAPAFLVDGLIFSTPQNRFLKQGRATDTYSLQDNANWVKGKHDFSFGFTSQFIRVEPFNDGGILPDYTVGISAANTTGFTAANFPGIRAVDVNVANNLYASLGGIVSGAVQSFNVRDRTSGFVPNYSQIRNFKYDTYAGYFQDRWKASRKLTLTLGVRYEYWTPLDEANGLYLLPQSNANFIASLLNPGTVLDFAGGSTGRRFYNPDKNNFAPNFGFAFDPTGRGKTAIRGGYSISFINDEAVTAVRNNVGTNAGLAGTSQLVRLTQTLANKPPVPTPQFKVPRSLADNYAADPFAAAGMPDPTLRSAYVQQWSFGVQHDVKGSIVELRYVGNRGTKLLRALDYNQVVVRENGFIDDVIRAQNNGYRSLTANGRFDPSYNPAIAGSVPLPVFSRLEAGGLLNNATIQNLVRTGEVGSLGEIYQTNGLNGAINFFRNPNILGGNGIGNGADSTYHALQADFRRRTQKGLEFQVNYTYSKVLSNGVGDDQARFEPYLDLASPSLERARAPFDLNHAIKANGFYELPFGKGKRVELQGIADKILGGWIVSGLMNYTSGTPFSIFSNRGTLNRGGRATGRNTAIALANKADLDAAVGRVFMTGSGPRFVNPSAIGADLRGTAGDGLPAFNGQLFYNPGAGALGTLQRRMFSGPWNFNLDTGFMKNFTIKEGHTVQFRAEAFNLFNNPSFWVGSETTATTRFNINQTTFGRIVSTFNGSREFQFSLYYRF